MFSAVSRQYCTRYDVKRIALQLQPGVVAAAERVCHLDLLFEAGYRVQFKLQGELALLGESLSRIDADGTLTAMAGQGDSAAQEPLLERFFKSIEGRLQRIRHEQEVQNIRYLGNTFVLHGRTVFDVVADEDGRLTLEMHRGSERQQAMLLASALLDGLYDGSIVPR